MRLSAVTLTVLVLLSARCSRGPDPSGASDARAPDGDRASGNGDGSDAIDGVPGDDLLVFPEGLSNTNLDGEDVGLTLVAFTLIQQDGGLALYAAVKNDGNTPACEAGMTTYFIDQDDQVLTSSGTVLESGRLYRMADGTVIPCIDPGQVAMAASTDLPSSLSVGQIAYLKHIFPSFTLDSIVPTPGLSVAHLALVATHGAYAYTGEVINQLDLGASALRVTVFPVNRVGRPLGAATASETAALPAGGSWSFTTTTLDNPGVDQAAYPAASIETQ